MRTLLGLYMGIGCLFVGIHEPFGFWDFLGYGIIGLTIIHKLKKI
jgi:hypothetical protein